MSGRETEPAPPPCEIAEYLRSERDRLLAIARLAEERGDHIRAGSALGWAYRMHDSLLEEEQ